MRISRSPRAKRILDFIVTKKPKTLYQIARETGIRPNSVHLAIGNLVKKNLIALDLERSRNRGRNATIYTPTFKGLLAFLSNYCLPQPPGGWRARLPGDEEEEAIKKLSDQFKRQKNVFERGVEDLKAILEDKGASIHYPLFQHCRSLPLHPRSYEFFIKAAQEILRIPFQMHAYEKSLLALKTDLEKEITKAEKLQSIGHFRLVIDGKETPFDPADPYRQRLGSVNLVLDNVVAKQDEVLRESFFLRFLLIFQAYQRLPNQELHDYTLKLLEQRQKEFDSLKKQLEAGLTLFSTS